MMRQGPLSNVPASPEGVVVMAITPDQSDHVGLRNIFAHTRWRLLQARKCREALDLLEQNVVGVLICESKLPDGSWRELLEAVSKLPASPPLIVTSKNTDDALWAEALNLGAYDVVTKPFERAEVTRIVSLAWLYWKERRASSARKTAGAAPGGEARALQRKPAAA